MPKSTKRCNNKKSFKSPKKNAWKYNLTFVDLNTHKVDQNFTVGHLGQFTVSHVSRIWQIHYKVKANTLQGQNEPRVIDSAKHKPWCPEIAWNGLKWLKITPNGTEWLQVAPNMAKKDSKLLNIFQNCFKLLNIFQNCSNLLKMPPNIFKWLKIAWNGWK